MAVDFRYASEKLGAAVRSLMLPHDVDEETSMASATDIGLAYCEENEAMLAVLDRFPMAEELEG